MAEELRAAGGDQRHLPGDEVKQFVHLNAGRGIVVAGRPVLQRDLVQFADLGCAAAQQFDAGDPYISAAEVERQILPGFIAARLADKGGQHLQRRGPPGEAVVHGRRKIIRNAPELRR